MTPCVPPAWNRRRWRRGSAPVSPPPAGCLTFAIARVSRTSRPRSRSSVSGSRSRSARLSASARRRLRGPGRSVALRQVVLADADLDDARLVDSGDAHVLEHPVVDLALLRVLDHDLL